MKRALLLAAVLIAVLAGGYLYLERSGGPASMSGLLARISGRPAPAPAPAAPAQLPPEVGIVDVRATAIPYPVQFTGRVVSYRNIEVRPRVSGLLLKREFDEGTRVREGQVLFRIDPATYQLALDRTEAQLTQARAALRQVEDNFSRIEELVRRQVGTERQREEALSQRDQARANVQLAEAEVATARLNLSYTTVAAPAAGITALQSPATGTLIQAQQTLLTTISQIDPAYVSFSFTEAEGRAFRELNQRLPKPISERDLTVELHFGTGAIYPQRGRVDISAQRIDPQTGTIEARAIFPNPDGALLPGQFVRVVVQGIVLPDTIVVPPPAVSQGPQGPFVYVLEANDIAQARPVRLSTQVAEGWIVGSGLRPGDRVIVDGVIRVRPGVPVRPLPATPSPVTRNGNAETTGATAPPAGARP